MCDFDVLAQYCRNSSVLAMAVLQSCAKLSICISYLKALRIFHIRHSCACSGRHHINMGHLITKSRCTWSTCLVLLKDADERNINDVRFQTGRTQRQYITRDSLSQIAMNFSGLCALDSSYCTSHPNLHIFQIRSSETLLRVIVPSNPMQMMIWLDSVYSLPLSPCFCPLVHEDNP